MLNRTAEVNRKTKETEIELILNLDGSGVGKVETGIGFLDHMLHTLVLHARLDLQLSCLGDLQVDDHHSAEDCAIALGEAIRAALGDKKGIARFGYAYAPLDEALARAVIDFSGRPAAAISLALERERIGEIACENISHFFSSLASSMRASLHLDVIRGENDHHRAEAAFKALALALRAAVVRVDSEGLLPSTKGAL